MAFLKLLRDTINIDIYDLNFLYSSEDLMMPLLKVAPSVFQKQGVGLRIGAFIWYFVKSIKHLKVIKPRRKQKGCVVFFFFTQNQRDSLSQVVEATGKKSLFVGFDLSGKLDLQGAQRFPVFYSNLSSLFFFPLVFFKFWKARCYKKKTFRFAFDDYWRVYGVYLIARVWLRWCEPRGVVVANDHSAINRAFTQAAKSEGIITFYIQHASVTDKFPPLFFNYALLEGLDALRKYERAGASRTKVFLIGMPKMDKYFQHINTNMTISTVGICINQFDPISRVKDLCKYLHYRFPKLLFFFRPHPSDKRDLFWSNLSKKYGMKLSCSKTEHPFDFIKRVDAIISGDSNILLEAALMNVFPLYYDFALTHLDWYGFQQNGLVSYFSDPEQLCLGIIELSNNKVPIRRKTRVYCATVNTLYDGRSGELAATLIRDLLSNDSSTLKGWKRIANTKLEAYEHC